MKTIYLLLTSCLLLLLLSACTDNNTDEGENTDSGLLEFYEDTNRAIWQKPDMVQGLFGDLSGKVVADIGAGNGFFTYRLAKDAAKVIAIEINQKVVDKLDEGTPEALKGKVETRLVEPNNPMLRPEEADAVLVVITYYLLDNRVSYLRKVRNGMASGGKLLICDFKKKQTTIGPDTEYRVPLYQVEQELLKAGFKILKSDDTTLEYQYIVLAEKID